MPALERRYDEAVARAEYMQHLKDVASTQDLSQDIRSRALGLSIGFTVFATVVVAMRFIARKKQGAAIMTDDWMIVGSLIMLFGNLAMNICLVNLGIGLHTGSLTYEQLAVMNETLVGAEIIYFTGVNMFKLSLLFLYFRIFPMPVVRKWGILFGCISIAWNVGCIFAALFQCVPREKLWRPWLQGGCIDLFLTQLCVSVPVILLDMCILLLPLPHVWRLKMNLTQKVFLTIIFLLGSYVVFTSIYRFVIFLEYNNDDNSYTLGDGIAWNVIEISSGIISACLPTLGPLFRPIFKGLTSITTIARYGGRPSNGGYSRDAFGTAPGASGGRSSRRLTITKGGSFSQSIRRSMAEFGSSDQVLATDTEGCVELAANGTHTTTSAASEGYQGSLDYELPRVATSKGDTEISWTIQELDEGGSREGSERTTK